MTTEKEQLEALKKSLIAADKQVREIMNKPDRTDDQNVQGVTAQCLLILASTAVGVVGALAATEETEENTQNDPFKYLTEKLKELETK